MSKRDLAIMDANKFLKDNNLPLLNLNPEKSDVRKAHMSLVRKFHPDTNPGVDENILKTINNLFDTLK
jgi:curved DNA-binding protein CbpA